MKYRLCILFLLVSGLNARAVDGPELAEPELTTSPTAGARAAASAPAKEEDRRVASLRLDKVSMRDAARLLTATTDKQVVVSEKANGVIIDLLLKDVTCATALDAICRSYGLIYTADSQRHDIFYVQTAEEFKGNLQFNNPDETKVIPILYPAARDIGDALAKLFIDRVVWQEPDTDSGDASDAVNRSLSRMDIMAQRGTIDASAYSGTAGGNTANNYGAYGSYNYNNSRYGYNDYGYNRYSSRGYNAVNFNNHAANLRQDLKDIQNARAGADNLTASQLRELSRVKEKELDYERLQRTVARPGVVYISVLPQTNDLLLRSADKKAMEQICRLVSQLDKPAPQVLLEVKVLAVKLNGTKERGVSYLFADNKVSGGFAADAPAGTMLGAGTNGYSVVNLIADNFAMRIKALEKDNKVSELMTPNLMVSDNESSTIFIGEERTILEKAQQTTTYITNSDGNATPQTSWEIEAPRRQIGTSLTITPKIHADRTVTIRLLQEHSKLGEEQRNVFSGTDKGKLIDPQSESQYFISNNIDLQRLVSTVVGQDKKYIVVGGLVREKIEKDSEKVPVLGNIPVVGAAFGNKTAKREREEIIVVIRPFVMIAPGESQTVSKEYLERISQHPSARGDIPSLGVTAARDMLKPRQIDPYDPWLQQMFSRLDLSDDANANLDKTGQKLNRAFNRLDGGWDVDDRERFPQNTAKQLQRDRREYAPGELEKIAREAGITVADQWQEVK